MKFEDYETQKSFEIWAFGPTDTEYDYQMKCLYRWNSRHGDKLWLLPEGNMLEDIERMFELYEKFKLENEED